MIVLYRVLSYCIYRFNIQIILNRVLSYYSIAEEKPHLRYSEDKSRAKPRQSIIAVHSTIHTH